MAASYPQIFRVRQKFERPLLRTVEPTPPEDRGPALAEATSEPRAAVRRPAPVALDEQSGPPRLRIHMEETTDEEADRRRLKKIVDLLVAAPGEIPAELAITSRGGVTQLLRLPGGVRLSIWSKHQREAIKSGTAYLYFFPQGFTERSQVVVRQGNNAWTLVMGGQFHDIAAGRNLYYPATPGWDYATGLGTPDVYNLARDLAG